MCAKRFRNEGANHVRSSLDPIYVTLGAAKMYEDLKEHFLWSGIKKNVVEYVENFLTCQSVKAEHKLPGGEL